MALFFPDHGSSFGKPGGQGISLAVVVAAHAALLGLIATTAPVERVAHLTRPFIARVIELAPEVPSPPEPAPPAPPRQPPKETSPVPLPVRVARPPTPAPKATPFAVAPQPPAPVESPPIVAAPVVVPVEPVISARFDAEYLHNPKPVYPTASRRLGEQGKVLLRVRVSADGLPEKVEITSSSGFTRLDRAAEAAVSRWHFVPAQRGAEAIAAWVQVPVRFQLDG